MTRKRNLGSVAAIGGLTATVALLTGLPAATADELADLRANQELLQRRIEQLAQGAVPRGGGAAGSNVYGTEAVPGAAMSGGSFPRSFLIPGTDTSIRVGGFVDEKFLYYFQNGPPNGNFSTGPGNTGNLTTMPLDVHGQIVPGLPVPGQLAPVNIQHSRGNGVFGQSPRESRLNVETRTPTAWGESRTFIEFDFAGCANGSCQTLLHVSDNLVPRLRYAYGTLGGFLAGQANSNFSDPDANAETLDFSGPIGQAGRSRVPQFRYTLAGPWASAWSIAAEAPNTELFTPAGAVETSTNTSAPNAAIANTGTTACVANGVVVATTGGCVLSGIPAKSSAPALTFASYWAQPWGHVNFRGLLNFPEVQDGRFINQKFVGYGGGISGDVKPGWLGWSKDDFQWQFSVGNAIGGYISDNTNGALATNYTTLPATAAAAGNIIVKPIAEFGAQIGYQHWWLPNLRSNAAFGYAYYDVPAQLIGPLQSLNSNKQLMTAHFNVIWSPVAFVDTGVEYMFGQRKAVANIYGTEQVLLGNFRVKF